VFVFIILNKFDLTSTIYAAAAAAMTIAILLCFSTKTLKTHYRAPVNILVTRNAAITNKGALRIRASDVAMSPTWAGIAAGGLARDH
jgi:hypothetical protein